ncbi:ubiquitin-like-conjugating enzyme ATG10 [Marchantia polymorpha subsp. ruderalis]|uniref:Ubiquitin-like-conjugating enzyme ATG10 n=2 Tax=Marchantia polymorpha TaxID=3197 RepID=A0A176WLN8_MARPO|nr:hypothetical protein AXG93_1200s1570 [Marchantia polymorpha subsp. ruderalis]PTQ49879.1 hypothetical protein MARPO_0002s0314 [Marchantia polymorpha]BBM99998.1 hypothetical protein Mp_1g25570 [Marchantia polymorpha subsp. ruderalis]|eukprot:PTQ49879.1 hypothetical protein MARPO_0002s0314 [Marchantia polymorpha]
MWDGTLSAADFQYASKEFMKLWNHEECNMNQWSWEERPESSAQGYLILEGVSLPEIETPLMHESLSMETDDKEELFSDDATLTDLTSQPSRCTYHVIYNESYNVPTIYFRGYHSDGSPINWLDIHMSLPSHLAQQMDQNRWTFLTQEEHPYLHRPWFMLHPCGTSSIMSLMSTERLKQKSRGYATPPEPRKRGEGEDKQAVPSRSSDLEFDTKLEFIPSIREAPTNQVGNYRDQYLLTWLSFVGPAVRLPVPLDLFKSLN